MANRILLEKEIKEYCQLNGIKDSSKFITQCMLIGFNISKYGTSPGDNIRRQNGINDTKEEDIKPIKKDKITTNTNQDNDESNIVVKKKKKITVTKVN